MSSRPAPVRIDDLAQPRFSDEVRAILDFMDEAGSQLTLEPRALMDTATGETGLEDFGAPDFRERLDVLCRAMREEGGFNGAGVLQQHAFLTGLLKNRLLIEDLLRRHPEILEQQIVAPIVICGLPRTGTTHLHNLMSADPALRSLPYWESLEPVLAERERPAPGAPDPRKERTEMALSFLDTALPYFKRMHEMTVEHTHEEIQLLAIDFSTMLFETTAPMPTWRDHYLARDQRSSYAYLLRVLKVLQWLRGGTRWVLKSPQHLEQFPALVDTFPDATFVVTHRDPVSVTASMVTMIAYSARLTRDRVDVGEHRPLLGGPARAHAAAAARPSATSCRRPGRSTCASTSSWRTTWPWSARVYDLAGQPLDDAAPRRHGGVHGRAPTGPVSAPSATTSASSGWTRPSGGGRCPSTPSASGSRSSPSGWPSAGCGPAARHVHAQVHEQHERRQHVPPHVAQRDPDAAWVEDHLVTREQVVCPRGEHVEGQQSQGQSDHARRPPRLNHVRVRPRFPSNRSTV